MTDPQPCVPTARLLAEPAELTDSETERLEELLLKRFAGEVCFNGEDLTSDNGDTLGEIVGRTLTLTPWVIWEFPAEEAGLDHFNHPRMTALIDHLDDAFGALGFTTYEEVLDRAPAVALNKAERQYTSVEEIVELIAAARTIGFLHMVEGPGEKPDTETTEMLSLADVRACLPDGIVATTTSVGWHSILNPDGTHVGSVVPEDRLLCFDVGLYSAPADAKSAEQIEELREELERVLAELVLPAWRAEGFRLDTVEECAVAGSEWWYIVARLEADFVTAADLKRLLAYAMSNAEAIGSTIDQARVASWPR